MPGIKALGLGVHQLFYLVDWLGKEYAHVKLTGIVAHIVGGVGVKQKIRSEHHAGGIFGAVREETVDGYEKTFQVTHLSPFLLTNLLLDELSEGEGVVVNTASLGAKLFSELDMDDLNLQHDYSSTRAYGNSKLANILFAKELSVRFADRGIFGVSYHPGSIGSNIGTGTTGLAGRFYSSRLLKPFLRSTNYGADRMVYLVNGRLGVDFIPGGYYQNDRPAKSAPLAADPNAASELWEKSAEMVGVLV